VEDKGYEGSSIDEIAPRAKLAVGTSTNFRSKRQLLLALMDELLEKLSQLDFRPTASTDVRLGLRELLSRAFSTISSTWENIGPGRRPCFLIRTWRRNNRRFTPGRPTVSRLFRLLQQLPSDACARQQKAEHHAGRTSACDTAADVQSFWRRRCRFYHGCFGNLNEMTPLHNRSAPIFCFLLPVGKSLHPRPLWW
jgi:AcrR family transcriptional regulator